ncbi:hypothetical protein JOD54_001496 [Actinokineospora baliensis]|uniref:hypothetical protein n=1 Tax=Actinokineospora baliensis TaxID=547056 RepID=UPI0019572DD2|nr:hypothetical protein [Actinokineospora baliensis]MBM7771292.1 hypothetical protein [Actinokineospora baliensis]
MTFNLEYTSTRQDISYTLTVTADADGDLAIDVSGKGDDGTLLAQGNLRLPPGGAAEAAKLLRESLVAIAALDTKRRTTGNANQPWSAEQDTTLREAWLAHPPTKQAAEAIRELAEQRQRSVAAIRARLPRVGCDPDVTGRLLTETSAALVGRDAVVTS